MTSQRSLFGRLRRHQAMATPFDGSVSIEGGEVVVRSAEGQHRSMKLADFLAAVAPRRPDSAGCIHPSGVKLWHTYPGGLVAVHQTAPRIWSFKWIDGDSPRRFGSGTSYRIVRLALPYLVVMAVFEGFDRGRPALASWNECFFARDPLEKAGLDTPLCYPALLNCSRFDDDQRPLSWICVQHLDQRPPVDPAHQGRGLRDGLAALLRHLLETGFNYSSEQHELNSWFSETMDARVDPRVTSVETWQAATEADGLFAVDVPWLPVERTLGGVLERIARARGSEAPAVRTEADVARIVCNASAAARKQGGKP